MKDGEVVRKIERKDEEVVRKIERKEGEIVRRMTDRKEGEIVRKVKRKEGERQRGGGRGSDEEESKEGEKFWKMTDTICSSSDEEEILTYKLKIHDANFTDSGKWKCEVKDKYGSVSTACDINVYEEAKRQALTSSSKVEAIQNETSVNGTSTDSEEEILTYRLKIHDANVKDAGKWKCEVKDKYGSASTSCNLDVFDSSPAQEEPRFLMALRNVTALEGQSVKLICRVRGIPLPKIVWYKDDTPIPKDDYSYQVLYLKDGTISLEIFYPKADKDAAIFKCEAQNEKGVATSESKVTVISKNRGDSLSRDQLLSFSRYSRARSETRCSSNESRSSTRAASEARYSNSSSTPSTKRIEDFYLSGSSRKKWSYNDVDDNSSIYDIYKPGYSPLKFLSSHESEPVMKLKVKWGSDEEFYFQENLKNKCCNEGSRLYLSAYVIGKLPLFVQWYKDSKPLPKNIYERHGIRSRAGHLSLEIPCTELEDTGDYLVDVRNEQGRINSSCYIQIEPKYKHKIDAETPTFVEGIHHVHVNEGQTATFQIIARGNPQPGITWFKDGRRIQMTEKITIHNGKKGGSILMIHSCDFSDMGLYKVEAHNYAGRCYGSAKLIVFESGVRFECEEDGEFKIIKRRSSLRSEDANEDVIISSRKMRISHEDENLRSGISKYDRHAEATLSTRRSTKLESRSKVTGLDEVDVDLTSGKNNKKLSNGELQNYELISKVKSSKVNESANIGTSVTNRETLTQTGEKLAKTDTVQDSSLTDQDQSMKVNRKLSERMDKVQTEDLQMKSSSSSSSEITNTTETENISKGIKSTEKSESSEIQSSTSITASKTDNTTELSSSLETISVDKSMVNLESSTSSEDLKLSRKSSKIEDESSEFKNRNSTTTDETDAKSTDTVITESKENSKVKIEADESMSTKKTDMKRRVSEDVLVESTLNGRSWVMFDSMDIKNKSELSSKLTNNGKTNKRKNSKEVAESFEKSIIKTEKAESQNSKDTNSLKSDQQKEIPAQRRKKSVTNERSEVKVTDDGASLMKESSNGVQSKVKAESLRVSDSVNDAVGVNIEGNTESSEVTKAADDKYRRTEAKTENTELKISANVEDNIKEEVDVKLESVKAESSAKVENNIKEAVDVKPERTKVESSVKVENNIKEAVDVKPESAKVESSSHVENNMKEAVDINPESAKVKSSAEVEDQIDKVAKIEVKSEIKTENTKVKSSTVVEDQIEKVAEVEVKSEIKTENTKVKSSAVIEDQIEKVAEAEVKSEIKIESTKVKSSAVIEDQIEKVAEAEVKSEIKTENTKVKSSAVVEDQIEKVAEAEVKSEIKIESTKVKSSADLEDKTKKVAEVEVKSEMKTENTKVKSSADVEDKTEKVAEVEVKSEMKTENTKRSNDVVDQPKEIAANVSNTEATLSSEENISKDNPAKSSENNPLNKERTNDTSKVKVDREINEKSLVRTDNLVANEHEAEITTEENNVTEEKETIYTTPPNIVKYLPKLVELKDGEKLQLQCLVSGEPKPKVTWLHNSKKISSEKSYVSLTSKAEYHNLEILETDFVRDSGTYTIKASNISGDKESNCEVKIEGSLKKSEETAAKEEADLKLKTDQNGVEEKRDSILAGAGLDEKRDSKVIDAGLEEKRNSKVDDAGLEEKSDLKSNPKSVDEKKQSKEDVIEIKGTKSSKRNAADEELRSTLSKGSEESKKVQVEEVQEVSSKTDMCLTSPSSSLQKEPSGSAHFAVPLQEEYHPMERDEDVRLYVKVAGEPYSPAKWFKDGEELEQSRRILINWDTVTQESTVVFRRFKVIDPGVYECVILTDKGPIKTKTVLNLIRLESQRVESTVPLDASEISVIPMILYPIRDITVYKGQEAYFECAVDKKPNISVRWFKGGEELTHKKRKYIFKESKGVYSMTVEDVQDSDCCSYTCQVTGDEGVSSVSANIIMEAGKNKNTELGPPKVTTKPDTIVGVEAGGVVVLKCCAEANPPAKFKWQKDMVDIMQSPRVVVSVADPGQSTLTISDVCYTDRGMYVCVVKNRLGRVKIRCNLHVGDEFKVKEKKMTETRETTTSVVEKINVEESAKQEGTQKSTIDMVTEKLDEIDVAGLMTSKARDTTQNAELKIDDNESKRKNEEIEKIRLAAEKSALLAAEEEKARKEAEEQEQARKKAEEEERDKLATEVAERDRIAAEKAAILAAKEAEKEKQKAEEEERARLAAEEAEIVKQKAEEQQRAQPKKKKHRLTFEEAEKLRLAEDSEQTENKESVTSEAGLSGEAEKARIAAEEAEKTRIAAEEVEKARLAKEAEKARLVAEEAEKTRIAAEEAEKTRIAAEEVEKARLAAEAEKARIAAEEAEKVRIAAEEAEKAKPKKKKQRLTFEEAEKQRLEEEKSAKIEEANNETELAVNTDEDKNARIAAEEAEKARIAAEAEKARVASEAEKARLAAEEAEKARLATEEVERERIAAEEAEKARIAAEAEKARIVAEAEKARIAVEAEKAKLAAEEAEKARLAAEEAENVRLAAEEAEKARLAAEAEKARIAAEAENARLAAEAEKVRIAAEEAEKARIAAEEAEKARIAAEEAEKARIAAEEAEKSKPKKKKYRLTFEEAEKQRLEEEKSANIGEAAVTDEDKKTRRDAEEAENARIAAEEAEKDRLEAEAEKTRLAAEEAEKARIAAEEAEKARLETEAEKTRLAAEEAEKARIAAEEAEKVRIAAEAEKVRIAAEAEKPKKKKYRLTFEEAEKLRLEEENEAKTSNKGSGNNETELAEKAKIAAEQAEKANIAKEEAEKVRLAMEVEKTRIAAEEVEKAKLAMEAEKARFAEESKTEIDNDYKAKHQKKHRLTFEEAEKLRLETDAAERTSKSETHEEKISEQTLNTISIPSSINSVNTVVEESVTSTTVSSVQSLCSGTEGQTKSESHSTVTREVVDGGVVSKMTDQTVNEVLSRKDVVMETTGEGKVSEINQSSVSQIDSTQQDVASQIRHQLKKQLSVGGSSCEILEVSTQRVTKTTGEATTVQHGHAHHHVHHPPEIIVCPDSKRVPTHSELEITVRVKASKHAKVSWVHDGERVSFKGQQHYELITEEEPIKE